MTATQQDKAQWLATFQLYEATKRADEARDLLTVAAFNFDRCGQPERGRECQKMAGILGGQGITINDLYRQLTEEEEQ